MEEEKAWFQKKKDEVHFLIEIDDDVPAGQVSLIHLFHKEKMAELTIFLDDTYWQKGYGTAATKLMLHYAFAELNFHKVYLHVYEGNDRAKAMYESLGFIQEGILRDFVFKGGKFLSAYYLGILKDEFERKADLSGLRETLWYDDGKS